MPAHNSLQNQPVRLPARRTPGQRAFSLIELLVVLVILVIVIAIVIPSLRHFRDVSRKSASTNVMASLATAVSQFRLSQNRLPGYFSPAEMGAASNATNMGGFSAMENIMLDLAGGVTADPTSGSGDPCVQGSYSVIEVGPDAGKRARVDLGRIGSAEVGARNTVTRGYYKPDPKYFVRQCSPAQRAGTSPGDPRLAMPVLVDAWGSPILAWSKDDVPGSAVPFSANDSSSRALFYSPSNAVFTNATSLGRLGQNQAEPTSGSLLSSSVDADNARRSIQGVVGNPAFPGEARAPLVFHSPGANGVYVGRSERGGKAFGSAGYLVTPAGRDYFQEGDFDDFVIKAE